MPNYSHGLKEQMVRYHLTVASGSKAECSMFIPADIVNTPAIS